MQEDLENKSVVLATKTTKLTGKVLALLMREALQKITQSRDAPKQGKQTLKQLAKGGSLSNIEITNDNIKSFQPVARKYHVSYSLKKDDTSVPPKHFVFFRAKDLDTMTAAFKEFSAKTIKRENDRPSVKKSVEKSAELVKKPVRTRAKNKQRGGLER